MRTWPPAAAQTCPVLARADTGADIDHGPLSFHLGTPPRAVIYPANRASRGDVVRRQQPRDRSPIERWQPRRSARHACRASSPPSSPIGRSDRRARLAERAASPRASTRSLRGWRSSQMKRRQRRRRRRRRHGARGAVQAVPRAPLQRLRWQTRAPTARPHGCSRPPPEAIPAALPAPATAGNPAAGPRRGQPVSTALLIGEGLAIAAPTLARPARSVRIPRATVVTLSSARSSGSVAAKEEARSQRGSSRSREAYRPSSRPTKAARKEILVEPPLTEAAEIEAVAAGTEAETEAEVEAGAEAAVAPEWFRRRSVCRTTCRTAGGSKSTVSRMSKRLNASIRCVC
jgi:hypothetical protein